MLVALYVGQAHVWNYESNSIIKTFEIAELPVRVGKFVHRKNWVITGSVCPIAALKYRTRRFGFLLKRNES